MREVAERPLVGDVREIDLASVLEWDVANWSSALAYWERHTRLSFAESQALELGARHGGLSLWLALKGFRVVCSDIEGPSPRAAPLHERYGVRDQIEYRAVNGTDLPYEGSLDLVCFKSVLGAIGMHDRKDLQRRAVDEMHRALRPGGEVWFAENLAASPLHRAARRRFVRWGTDWRYVTPAEIEELFGGFSDLHYTTVGFTAAFGRSEWQRRLLGRLDRAGVAAVVPPAWRYVAIGVARK